MLAHIRKTIETRGSDSGASAVAYALLVVAIALILVVGAFLLGGAINDRFDDSADCVTNANAEDSNC